MAKRTAVVLAAEWIQRPGVAIVSVSKMTDSLSFLQGKLGAGASSRTDQRWVPTRKVGCLQHETACMSIEVG